MAKKIKGKEWYKIIAPKFFEEKILGETPADDVKKLISRTIEVPLVLITNNMNKFYIKVKFKIISVEGNKAYTEFVGLECLRDYISRMIRHGINRIDVVQKLKTKDEKNVVVKSIIITNRKVNKGVEKEIRKLVIEILKKIVTENKLDDTLAKILDDSIRNKILKEGSKIYPIRSFDIRKMEVH